MTFISQLCVSLEKIEDNCIPDRFDSKDISIVIPVKNNQLGVNTFLETYNEIFDDNKRVLEVLIVDNNSTNPIVIPDNLSKTDILLLCCEKKGPASARNLGWRYAKGNWVLFVDSDCIPTSSLIQGFLKAQNGALAYAGNVSTKGENRIEQFYLSQETFLPPHKKDAINISPDYLVTANCLINKKVLERVNGFNELFSFAGGEDTDLGLRISQYGNLSYALDSHVVHDVRDNYADFIKRFYRYGWSLNMLLKIHGAKCMPKPEKPKRISFNDVILTLLMNFSIYLGFVMSKIQLTNDKLNKQTEL